MDCAIVGYLSESCEAPKRHLVGRPDEPLRSSWLCGGLDGNGL